MLDPSQDYDTLRRRFRWAIPERLNLAAQACHDRAAREPERLAIIDLTEAGPLGLDRRDVTHGELSAMAHALARHLAGAGVGRGDRVGVLRTQSPWTAAAHLAIWQMGAISVPLFKLFGPDALRARISDAGAAHAVADPEGAQMLAPFGVAAHVPEALELDLGGPPMPVAETGPEDGAVLIYTSGTTGSPKGALHGHRVLTGHLPGVWMSHDRLGQPGDCLWTPADWAWIGGLFDVAMPGLALGVPVVAARLAKFTPEGCLDVLRQGTVRNVFLPPTALKMLRAEGARVPGLRSVASGGEPLGAEMLAWGREALGLEINEFYGQTECNMVASSSGALFPPRPGCIGRPAPGFEVAVLGAGGEPLEVGEGDIAIRRGAASMMLRYWGRPEETAARFRGDWLVTGDRGAWEAGYLRFVGREDDVITSAGYRIGPSEVEDCLMRHPAVALAAVVGKPCAMRTERVKAYVQLAPGHAATDDLAGALMRHVGEALSRHAAPREVAFVEGLPLTVTGKVIRRELRARARAEAEAEASGG